MSPPEPGLALGALAPDFTLAGVDGRTLSFDDAAGPNGLVVMFICNHCPYVKHVAAELARLGRDYLPRGVAVLAINANDPRKYPADSPENMKKEKQAQGYPFPYLFDESQEVARAYAAACTPDFFVFDAAMKLVYRGQLDDSRPNSGRPVTGRDLRAALDAVLAGRSVSGEQRPSAGCNIKWRA